jgi:hypothetical protein
MVSNNRFHSQSGSQMTKGCKRGTTFTCHKNMLTSVFIFSSLHATQKELPYQSNQHLEGSQQIQIQRAETNNTTLNLTVKIKLLYLHV